MLRAARILLVENEPIIAIELANTISEANGVISALARSREEALLKAQTADIDAAILDVLLPDGNGFCVASLLAERGIPFLFCTADSSDRQQFNDWPGVPVIAKPYRPEAMVREISQLLGKGLTACMAESMELNRSGSGA